MITDSLMDWLFWHTSQTFTLLFDIMIFPSIKLHKQHRPIHPDLEIKSQKDYDHYIALLNYLHNQVAKGFKPKYLISLHYNNPSEHLKAIRETNRPLGFGDRYGFKTPIPLWNSVAWDNFISYSRNDIDEVSRNARKVLNLILKTLYGVKRLNRPDKYEFPNLFFFHEQGKAKLQYHTHILIPETLYGYSVEELVDIFNTSIRERCKCISRWKYIDITPIEDKYDIDGILGYLNKETKASHTPLDFINSIPIV